MEKDGRVWGKGFSPAVYRCTIRVPGFVQLNRDVSFVAAPGADLGTNHLERAKQLTFSYIVPTNFPPSGITLVRTNLFADGLWHYDPGQPAAALTVHQDRDDLTFALPRGTASVSDLGEHTVQDLVSAITGKEDLQTSADVKVVTNHVYLLKLDTSEATTWLLLRVEAVGLRPLTVGSPPDGPRKPGSKPPYQRRSRRPNP